MFAKTVAFAALATLAVVSADHSFVLNNNCDSGTYINIINYSGTAYTGPQPGTIAAKGQFTTTIPNGWDGQLCNGDNCYTGVASLTEFNLDTGNQYTPNSYDISNILGFTVAQKIDATGGETVTCTSVDCACDQAYPPGNMAGTCPGSDTPDRPVRATSATNAAFTITYCP